MRNLRFGVNFHGTPETVDRWVGYCQEVEQLGYDSIMAPDHLGAPAPFAMLAAAAVATDRLRLGTYVANNGLWNPALLAREAATVDRLSGGRLELGLGAGTVKPEFDAAGIAWEKHADRVARLERTIGELDRLFAEDGQQPLPRQIPHPPLLIGGHSERTLALAARYANIVAFSGILQRPGGDGRELRLVPRAEVAQRVKLVRDQAGAGADRQEYSALLQFVVITDDREAEAERMVEQYGEPGTGMVDVASVLENPFALVGTAEEIAEEVLANREEFGFSYLVTHEPYRDALAEVIPRVRGLAGEARTGAPKPSEASV